MTRDEEQAIVHRVRAGDVNAFEELVTAYEKSVYNQALRMLRSREDAQDVTQEAFLKAYNSIDSFRGDSKFSVWLYRIAANLCLDFLRRRGQLPVVSLSPDEDDEKGRQAQIDLPDTEHAPEVMMEKLLTADAVRRGLRQLPEDARQILLLREIGGLSYEEIGQTLHLEAGTVKSRIFRARKKLCVFLLADGNIPDTIASRWTEGGETP